MGVLGIQSRLLFCEGHDQSLDRRLLNRLLDGTSTWTVLASGTKGGLGRFAQTYARLHGDPPWLAVRDRDFDLPPTETPGLSTPHGEGQRMRVLHRSAIENYLLDPKLIHQYWVEGSAGSAAEFRHPEGIETIQARIVRAARTLLPYQATRWALATLRDRQPRRLSTTWTGGSGHLPSVLTWEQCLADAMTLLKRSTGPELSASDLELEATRFQERFEDDAFWNASEHLVWFSGKDIAKQMQRDDPNLFGLDGFLSWAVPHLDWRVHPDLVSLANELANPLAS